MSTRALKWDSPTVSALISDADFGGLIRWARHQQHWRQADLGEAAGYSTASVSRLEHTRQPTDLAQIRIFARTLNIPAQVLGQVLRISPSVAANVASETSRPAPTERPHPAEGPAHGPTESEAAVRRREMLNGMLGLAAAPVLGLHGTLYHDAASAPVGIPRLAAALTGARADFRATRYTTLEPKLIQLCAAAAATRDARTGTSREAASAVLARAYCLASELATKQAKSGYAWVASDRALTEAKASGNPVALAEAAQRLSVAMRQDGQYTEATDLLSSTALSLQSDLGSRPALASYGSVLLIAAYTQAQAGHRASAIELLQEAEQAATRLGEAVADFSWQQCQLYRIGTHTALGEAVALDYAKRLDAAALPSTERRSRYWTDVARAWHMVGNPAQTLAALEAAEEVSVEDVRRPSMRSLTADLLTTSPNLVGLHSFAERIGAGRS